jgi:hypothetical protein
MKQTKPSGDANYWRNKFMQVLEALHDNDLNWSRDHWVDYGITEKDAQLIEDEFNKQVKWRAAQKKD